MLYYSQDFLSVDFLPYFFFLDFGCGDDSGDDSDDDSGLAERSSTVLDFVDRVLGEKLKLEGFIEYFDLGAASEDDSLLKDSLTFVNLRFDLSAGLDEYSLLEGSLGFVDLRVDLGAESEDHLALKSFVFFLA